MKIFLEKLLDKILNYIFLIKKISFYRSIFRYCICN